MILRDWKPVGLLRPDGSIQSDLPDLQQLNSVWQKEGIFTMCPSNKSTEEVTVDGAALVMPSEDIDLVIGSLEERGYQVVVGHQVNRDGSIPDSNMEKEAWVYVETWGGRSEFRYKGSVAEGTQISWKDRSTAAGWSKPWPVTAEQYRGILSHFSGQTVKVGNYRTVQPGSLEDWLKETYDQWGLTSYIPAILIREKYAERAPSLRGHIRFISTPG